METNSYSWFGAKNFERVVKYVEPTVRISGAVGPNAAAVNGDYEVIAREHNGQALRRKLDDPKLWLRFMTKKGRRQWAVSKTADLDANTDGCLCHCIAKDAEFTLPRSATSDGGELEDEEEEGDDDDVTKAWGSAWKVLGDDGKFVEQSTIDVSPTPAPCVCYHCMKKRGEEVSRTSSIDDIKCTLEHLPRSPPPVHDKAVALIGSGSLLNPMMGYITGFRHSKGIGRYTETFDPAFPYVS